LSSPPFVCGRWPSFASGRGRRRRFGVCLLSLTGGRARFVLLLAGWGLCGGWGCVTWHGEELVVVGCCAVYEAGKGRWDGGAYRGVPK
jgi:hypothetical protein